MKRATYILLILALSAPLFAARQDSAKHRLDMDYRVSFRGGVIRNDLFGNDKLKDICKTGINPTLGGEFAIAFHPDWQALHEWNDASVGVALSAYYLGNNEKLGYAIAPYAFLDVPLVRVPHFVMGLRLGLGIAFLTKYYYNTAIPDRIYGGSLTNSEGNYCIGSVFNFHFPEAIYLEFPIKDGWAITAGGGWYHFSNGSTIQPNTGYNIFAGELGVRYVPPTNAELRPCWTKNPDGRKKNWEVEIAWAGAARQVYYMDRQTFFGFTLQAAAYWRAHNVFRLGGGVDVFYDNSYVRRETTYGRFGRIPGTHTIAARENGADCWRLGVSVQPELVVGKLTCGFHIGMYLIDGVKNLEFDSKYATEAQKAEWQATGRVTKGIFYPYNILDAGQGGYPDGWLYTQLVLRYHLPYHLFIQGNMKTHISKVEFICLGIGAYL